MSSIGIRKELLSSLTECSTCSDICSDPIILPCLHTCCLGCIKGVSRIKLTGDSVSCPECREDFQDFPVVDNGTDSLPKNSCIFEKQKLKDVADAHADITIGSNWHCGISCDDGTHLSLRKHTSVYCIERQQHEANVEVHRSPSRGHGSAGEEVSVDSEDKNLPAGCCVKHEDGGAELCAECSVSNLALCLICFADERRLDIGPDVKRAADEFRQQMANNFEMMANNTCCCVIEENEEIVDCVNSVAKEIERKLCERAEHLKTMIDSEKTKLVQELAALKSSIVEKMQSTSEDVEQHLDSLVICVEELAVNKTASNVTEQGGTAQWDGTEELRKLDSFCHEVSNLSSVEISFEDDRIPNEEVEQEKGN